MVRLRFTHSGTHGYSAHKINAATSVETHKQKLERTVLIKHCMRVLFMDHIS